MFMVPGAIQDHHGAGKGGGETCTRGVPQCFREGRASGEVVQQEEVCATVRRRLNGNSWHRRSQLTTRTITYWTKKPMEKQHRIYVIGV